jgi:hypothetical protein
MPLFALYLMLELRLQKTTRMKAKIKKVAEVKGSTYLVKLRIDARTVITVRTKESLKNWKAKYPNAVELT